MDASAKRAEMHGLTNRCSGRIVRLDGKRNEDMTASNALVTTVKQSGKPSGLMRTRTRSVSRHSRCPAHSWQRARLRHQPSRPALLTLTHGAIAR